jgi:hypothetical protein
VRERQRRERSSGEGAQGKGRRGDWLARAGEENVCLPGTRLEKAFERIRLHVVCMGDSQARRLGGILDYFRGHQTVPMIPTRSSY